MAIDRLSVKVGKSGHAAKHARYICRLDEYEGLSSKKAERLEAVGHGNMPLWATHNPMLFWEASDQYERKNGSTYREFEIALPRELTPNQRLRLVQDFIKEEIGDIHAYSFGIHNTPATDGGEQPHCHLMFSERRNDGIDRDPSQYFKRYNATRPEVGGAKKGFGHNPGIKLSASERADELKALRARWEVVCNSALAEAGQLERIDMRSYKDRGIDRIPEPKMTPKGWRGRGRLLIDAMREARRAEAEAEAAMALAMAEIGDISLAIADAEKSTIDDRKSGLQTGDVPRLLDLKTILQNRTVPSSTPAKAKQKPRGGDKQLENNFKQGKPTSGLVVVVWARPVANDLFEERNAGVFVWARFGNVAFIDEGDSINVRSFHNESAIRASLQLAASKWGNVIRSTGDEEFRRISWKIGTEMGLVIQGYEPTESELAEVGMNGSEIPDITHIMGHYENTAMPDTEDDEGDNLGMHM